MGVAEHGKYPGIVKGREAGGRVGVRIVRVGHRCSHNRLIFTGTAGYIYSLAGNNCLLKKKFPVCRIGAMRNPRAE